ncbi:hypothetical protein ACQJBY_050847 [Aegilops geniculata]
MEQPGGQSSTGGENQAERSNPLGYLLTASSAIGRVQAPLRASYEHLGPFRGGAPRFGPSTASVSPARSPQFNNLLANRTVSAGSNNGVGHGLPFPMPPRVVQGQGSRYHATVRDGVLPSSLMQARSADHFTFQSSEPRSMAPNRGNHFYSQFLAPPRQVVPAQFLGGLTPTASGVVNASSALGASESTRAQSVFLLNSVDSGQRDVLAREAGTSIMQRREPTRRVGELAFLPGTGSVQGVDPLGFDDGLHHERSLLVGTGSVQHTTGFDDTRLHGHSLLASTRPALRMEMMGFEVHSLHRRVLLTGTGFVHRTELICFDIGVFRHTLLAVPGYVSRLSAGTRQMMESSGAGMTHEDNRAVVAVRNEAILRRLNRMVRVLEDGRRARADILAASRGRGRRGGGNLALPDGWN